MSVAPYYVELSDAPVETWYLVGGNFGDGSWGNSQVVPLLPMEGQEYDKKTGKGINFLDWLSVNSRLQTEEEPRELGCWSGWSGRKLWRVPL